MRFLAILLSILIVGCVAQTRAPVPAAPLGMEQMAPVRSVEPIELEVTSAPHATKSEKRRMLDRLDEIDRKLTVLEHKIPKEMR